MLNIIFATSLDPRFKKCFFEDALWQNTCKEIKLEILRNNGYSYDDSETVDVGSSDDSDDFPLAKIARQSSNNDNVDNQSNNNDVAHDMFWRTYGEFTGVGNKINKLSPSKTSKKDLLIKIENEMQIYIELPPIARTECPLAWWAKNKEMFPFLYELAVMYLTPPPSSVYSEQLFSSAGNVYESARSRLNPDRAESLILLHHNLPKLNFKY